MIVKRWASLICLCLVLLGVPVTMSACDLTGSSDVNSPTYSPTFVSNGSLQYPYPVTVSKGKCTAWRIVLDASGSNPLCAQMLPTRQVGAYVSLTYNDMLWTARLVSIDARRRIVEVR